MPRSKVRGGRKAHRKRVANRNLIKKRQQEKVQRELMEQLTTSS